VAPLKPQPSLVPPHIETVTIAHGSSAHVKSFAYDHNAGTLTVVFTGRNRPHAYVHTGVPAAVFESWKRWNQAGYSPGKFYHSHVKHYPIRPDHHFDKDKRAS
jgi:KTSC domain